MSINTPLDKGDGNGGSDLTAKNQGTITVTQDGVESDPLALQSHPRPPDENIAVEAGTAAGSSGGNGSKEGGTIINPPMVGYLTTLHTGQLPASTGNVETSISKANSPVK